MADSFADLWASSAPTKPAEPPKKLGSAVPVPSYPRRPQQDAFSILSASQPASRTPVANIQPTDRNTRPPQSNSRGGDAFSSLFIASLDASTPRRTQDRSNMTIAERAALAQRTKVAQNNGPTMNAHTSSTLWAGLDSLAQPTSISPRPAQEATSVPDDFDFGFDGVPASKTVPQTTSIANNRSTDADDWGIPEFSSLPQSESRSTSALAKPASGSKPATRPQPPSRSLAGTPGDFDFGDREDRLLGNDSDAEDTFGIRDGSGPSAQPDDDILGDLGKPVSHSPSPNPSTSTRAPARPPPRTTTSPPPHITGQLVEMGFSPIDARAALTNTMNENGFDVQAAAELLLSQAGGGRSGRPSPNPQERERRRDGDQDRDRDSRDRDRPTRRPPSNRADPQTRQSISPSQSASQSQAQVDITAEKLLSQATEIGRGMFSKANALWKEGREKAVKIYEERAAAANSGGNAIVDGRPRWMRDQEGIDAREGPRQWPKETDGQGGVNGGFRDDDDGTRERRERQRATPSRRPPQTQSRASPQPDSRPEQEIDLFSADAPPVAYQSPFRRGKSRTQAPPLSAPSISASVPSSQPPRVSRSPPQPVKFTTTITFSALASSTSHKSAGTDAFKRGDFPAALTAYMRALSALPSQHILRVPLLTNTALVRSKVGELRESMKDCEEAVTIIRQFLHGGDAGRGTAENAFGTSESDFDATTPINVGSGKVSMSVQGGGSSSVTGDLPTSVDLVEGLTKAFRRRAEALEGLEKWEVARGAWEALVGAEWAGANVKGEALRGVGRCRRMIEGSTGGSSGNTGAGAGSSSQPFPPRPRPPTRPAPTTSSSSAPTQPSAAITALRETEHAQQNEDAVRIACKDSVDARLTAWKGGREGNIRALLTSLDSVLWPELGWRRIGLAEVVGKGQVKGAYVRAIARVHPDKLNADNTTVEQRMIANGVFGALNEAWNVFQEQQQ